jgi:hypothetical protein
MLKRYLAVTQLGLNLRFNADAAPPRHDLQALLLDPSDGWRAQRFDLRYPGSDRVVETGEFVVSAVGHLDGRTHLDLVYAVTLDSDNCYILAYRYDGIGWRALPVINGLPSATYLRSIALGDLDKDGADEIVVGTRPSGAVFVLHAGPKGYVVSTIDSGQYGTGTTNTREVVVADVDSDGALEIVVATARAGSGKWEALPGAIFLYRRSAEGWDKILIEDHGGRTHTRMVAVADAKNDGVNHIISSAVGVVQPGSDRIDLEPELRMHTVTGRHATYQPIGTLENMIKSRSFAAGDIDGDGRTALVVGTRALGAPGLKTTCLFVYRFDHASQSWERETLDTSGPLGFHCVAIGDVDGDGQSEIVASDDGRGLIKLYKKLGKSWHKETIHAVDGMIFCMALHLIEVESVRP